MIIIQDNEDVQQPLLGSNIACIGTFDGMHLGHQELLMHAYKTGGGKYTVVTFSEMPQKILTDKNYKYMINNLQKEKLLMEQKATGIIYFDFEKIKDIDPHNFCKILYEKYGIKTIVVGEDFKFGKDRSGDIDFLKDYFSDKNVKIVPNKLVNGSKVSSSSIRESLMNGDLPLVNKLLGRAYSISGEVIHGNGAGSKIGFPTANLKVDLNYRLPKNGVYAVNIGLESSDDEYLGMMNIGYRPTLENSSDSLHLEVNIFNFDANIYGESLTVKFQAFLREEMKFENLDELSKQLSNDKKDAIKKLNL